MTPQDIRFVMALFLAAWPADAGLILTDGALPRRESGRLGASIDVTLFQAKC
jgi:hypothetical protein